MAVTEKQKLVFQVKTLPLLTFLHYLSNFIHRSQHAGLRLAAYFFVESAIVSEINGAV